MRLPLSVVLLQHARELGRPTATGPLLAHHSLQPHLRVQAWTWAGRGDNERIERQLEALSSPVLLWNGDGTGESEGTRLAQSSLAFLEMLNGSVPDAATRLQLLRFFSEQHTLTTQTAHLASGNATLFLTPDNFQLRMQVPGANED